MKKVKIAYDLGLNQSMYCVPKGTIKNLEKIFPVNFLLVNTPSTKKICEDADIYWGNRIDNEMIYKMPKLKWIHFGSVGVNRINNLKRNNLFVTSSKGLVTSAMTTNIISLIGLFSRNLDVFFKPDPFRPYTRDLFNKYFDNLRNFDELKILILGLGNIGKYLAEKLYLLGAKVDSVSNNKKYYNFINNEFKFNEIKKELINYDFVISLLPENKSTKDLLNYDFFQSFSENSIFINAGRGETCLEKDLIKSLDSGKPKLAILDVIKNEPLSTEDKIYTHPRTFITPHIFAFSPSYWPLEIKLFKQNLTFFLENNPKKMKNIEYIF